MAHTYVHGKHTIAKTGVVSTLLKACRHTLVVLVYRVTKNKLGVYWLIEKMYQRNAPWPEAATHKVSNIYAVDFVPSY